MMKTFLLLLLSASTMFGAGWLPVVRPLADSSTNVASPPEFAADVTSGAAPLQVKFFGPTNDATGNFHYAWDFNGDDTWDAINLTTNYYAFTYSNAVAYSVSLAFSNSLGWATNTKSGYITVTNAGAGGENNWTNSLVAYWRLDGDATDSVGSNDLADYGTPAYTTAMLSTGFTNDGSAGLTIADNAELSTGDIDFTIAAWVNLSAWSGNKAVVAKGALYLDDYGLYYRSSSDGPSFAWGTADILTVTNQYISGWHLWIGWHDASQHTNYLQIDTNAPVFCPAGAETANDTAGPFGIGITPALSEWQNTGTIDNVAIWKRVLTPTERTNLFNGALGRDILINP